MDTIDTINARQIRGWMGVRELQWLAAKAQVSRCIIEVGSFAGRSARAMGDNLQPDASLFCFDSLDPTQPGLERVPPGTGSAPTTLEEADPIFTELVNNLADLKQVQVFRLSSSEASYRASQWWSQGNTPIDFVFLDGDHSRESVAADIEAWLPLILPGGTLAGHDYYTVEQKHHPGVREAVDHYFGTKLVRHPAGSIWTWEVPK